MPVKVVKTKGGKFTVSDGSGKTFRKKPTTKAAASRQARAINRSLSKRGKI